MSQSTTEPAEVRSFQPCLAWCCGCPFDWIGWDPRTLFGLPFAFTGPSCSDCDWDIVTDARNRRFRSV